MGKAQYQLVNTSGLLMTPWLQYLARWHSTTELFLLHRVPQVWRFLLWLTGLQHAKFGVSLRDIGWVEQLRQQRQLGYSVVLASLTLRLATALGTLTWKSFAPKTVLRQLLVAIVFRCFYLLGTWASSIPLQGIRSLTTKGRKILEIQSNLTKVKSYREWRQEAAKYDRLTKCDSWRAIDKSDVYDESTLRVKIDTLQAMLNSGDLFSLMFELRAGLDRKDLPLTSEKLWERSLLGTKHIVHEYQELLCKCLTAISDSSLMDQSAGVNTVQKLGFFNEVRHAYGRTALLLSGGASAGFYHLGVIKALLEQRILPRIISGSSAGSIIAAVVAHRTDEELVELFKPGGIHLDFFAPERSSMKRHNSTGNLRSTWNEGMMLLPQPLQQLLSLLRDFFWKKQKLIMDSDHLGQNIRRNVGGDYTFQEAFDRTGRIINITVATTSEKGVPRLLNYLTAPHVVIWSAALASSSVPGVFRPAKLLAKDKYGKIRYWQQDDRGAAISKWSDGSVEWDLPIDRLRELFNVNTFIVSQVNFHALFLVSSGGSKNMLMALSNFLRAEVKSYIQNLSEIGTRTSTFKPLGLAIVNLLTQKYEGDVTIFPTHGESLALILHKVLSNPTPQELEHIIALSERNTWPMVPRLKTLLQVEIAMDICVQRLRTQLAREAEDMEGSNDSAGSSPSHKQNIGRIPSFFTSSSGDRLVSLADSQQPPLEPALAGSPILQLQELASREGRSTGREQETSGIGSRKTSMSNFYYRHWDQRQ